MTDLHKYSEALDAAWEAMEEAICSLQNLNDMVWTESGELPENPENRAPRADAALLVAKLKELKYQVETFDAAKAPSQLAPVLPQLYHPFLRA